MNSQIKTPFTPEQVKALNEYQNEGRFHPFTCQYDGDEKHILYEFNKIYPNENYKEYILNQKTLGISYPEMEFNQTSLIATENGWICPVCDYKQNWAHSFMSENK